MKKKKHLFKWSHLLVKYSPKNFWILFCHRKQRIEKNEPNIFKHGSEGKTKKKVFTSGVIPWRDFCLQCVEYCFINTNKLMEKISEKSVCSRHNFCRRLKKNIFFNEHHPDEFYAILFLRKPRQLCYLSLRRNWW